MKKIICFILLVVLLSVGCTEDKYTITFIGYNGEIIEKIEVETDTNIISPSVTSPAGKKFVGWDKPLDSITSDMTVYAVFEDVQPLEIKKINVTQNSISLNISNVVSDIRLYEGDIFIKEIPYEEELMISDLLSNKEYIIKYKYEEQNLEYKFKTLPIEPHYIIEVLNVNTNSISIIINEEDIDNIGEVKNIQVFKGDLLINESKEVEVTFDNLDENTEYLIVLEYYNSFKKETLTKELCVTTEKEVIIPEIDILNFDINYNYISFDVMVKIEENFEYINDNNLGENISLLIEELVVYKNEEVVTKITDIKDRIIIEELEECTSYKISLLYSYVLNDETIEEKVTKEVKTTDYFSSVFEYEIITYEPNSIKILGLKQDVSNLIIPDEYVINDVTYKIAEIGLNAFMDNSAIKSVIVGKNICLVEGHAFAHCLNLEEISFQKIDEKIDIVEFGTGVFEQCKNLKSVDLTNTKPLAISSDMFRDCEKLENVKLNGCEGFIGHYAFENCKELLSVENGMWIRTAYIGAFKNCEKLKSVEFPKLNNIFKKAFENCTSLETFRFDEVSGVAEYAFNNCLSLITIYLPITVKEIGSNAFSNCPLLIINTAYETKPDLWSEDFKDETTIVNYNVHDE